MTCATDTDYLDHSVFITKNYAAAWGLYERLGFTLSPPSRHKLSVAEGEPPVLGCTANRCAYFGENYIELIGIVDEHARDPWGSLREIEPYEGLRGMSFGLGAAPDALARLRTVGLAGSGVLSLRRPVDTVDGTRVVRANAIHLDRSKTPEGFLTVAEHLTPHYVHQDRYLHHANGAKHLRSILLVLPDNELEGYRERYAAMFSRPGQTEGARRVFQLRLGRVEIMPLSRLDEALPDETAPALPFIAAITVAVADSRAARTLIETNGISTRPLADGFFVSARDAHGASVIFQQT